MLRSTLKAWRYTSLTSHTTRRYDTHATVRHLQLRNLKVLSESVENDTTRWPTRLAVGTRFGKTCFANSFRFCRVFSVFARYGKTADRLVHTMWLMWTDPSYLISNSDIMSLRLVAALMSFSSPISHDYRLSAAKCRTLACSQPMCSQSSFCRNLPQLKDNKDTQNTTSRHKEDATDNVTMKMVIWSSVVRPHFSLFRLQPSLKARMLAA